MTTYESGSKPRFDGGGSEFGNMHRELPKNVGMFDIDRMKGKATIELEITRQNVAFIEYRTLWDDDENEIEWKALFEVKYNSGRTVDDALRVRKGTATWGQMMLAQDLGARYFIVVATRGLQPFTFYEINKDGAPECVGILDYTSDNKRSRVEEFWRSLGLL